MSDTPVPNGAMRGLIAEREDHRATKRKLTRVRRELGEFAGEISRLQLQIARLSAQVGRRDQTIQALRIQFKERGITHD